MVERRPIDLLRDSALQMDVGAENDRSPIREMCVIGGSMHVIKDQGIYRIQLADEIDPQRTNPAIPNTQQQVLSYGTDCTFVCQMLMTAKRLFDCKVLGDAFDCARAIDLTFEALKDVVGMHEIRLGLVATLDAITASLPGLTPKNRALSVPTAGSVRELVETFIQKADHANCDLFDIAKLFYPDGIGKRWFESLLALIKQKYGPDAPFTKFLTDALPFLKMIRNARNSIEHPKADQRIEIFDVTLLPNGQLRPPALEVIHPDTPQPVMAVVDFMAQSVEQLVETFELMLAFLCGHSVKPIVGLPVQVVRYPEDLQKAFLVRFGYGIYDGERVIPFG
jgi:hypothetical protein